MWSIYNLPNGKFEISDVVSVTIVTILTVSECVPMENPPLGMLGTALSLDQDFVHASTTPPPLPSLIITHNASCFMLMCVMQALSTPGPLSGPTVARTIPSMNHLTYDVLDFCLHCIIETSIRDCAQGLPTLSGPVQSLNRHGTKPSLPFVVPTIFTAPDVMVIKLLVNVASSSLCWVAAGVILAVCYVVSLRLFAARYSLTILIPLSQMYPRCTFSVARSL